MKLDKIKFAKIVALIATEYQRISENFIAELDCMIDIDVEPVKIDKISCEMVDELLRQMMTASKEGFIPAIKAYRSLTGAGLKEAKEAIERYRLYVGRTVVTEGATLGNATRDPPVNFDKFEGVEVIELSSGKWQAKRCIVNDPYEGYGSTMMEAIADLNEKLRDL